MDNYDTTLHLFWYIAQDLDGKMSSLMFPVLRFLCNFSGFMLVEFIAVSYSILG